MEAEVAVVGAGAAGIAAARALRARGKRVLVLEAGARVGGRAWTADGFDHGASWLHDAEANPLAPLARALGFAEHDTPRRQKLGLRIDGRLATEDERADYLDAIAAAEAAFARAAARGEDRDCLGLLPEGPWRATVAHWLGPIINGAALGGISVQDYVAIDLHGVNRALREGLGTLVERLAAGLEVRLNTPVTMVDASGPAVALHTPAGTVRAGAALVTVSTAVLAAGAIRFLPALPPAVETALAGLPLGLLSKVALRMVPGALPEVPAFGRLERRLAEGESGMTFALRPFGADLAIGFFGGAAAWELARQSEAATEAWAREELARSLGAATVVRAFLPGAVVTRWAQDPLFRGAYSHARVGAAGARQVLREAVLAGRVRFAGEALHPTHAATLGGAWASGEAAAAAF
jgi:monoamine oxidase